MSSADNILSLHFTFKTPTVSRSLFERNILTFPANLDSLLQAPLALGTPSFGALTIALRLICTID